VNPFEFIALIFVVIIIFVSPFAMSKILAWLRRKAEPQYAIGDLNGVEIENYKVLKENVRYFATFFILVGVVGVIGILVNDFGDWKPVYLSLMLFFLISAIGVWFRQIWGAWIIGLSILAFAISNITIFIINSDFESIIKSIPLCFFAVYITYKLGKNILSIRRIESAGIHNFH